MLRGTMAPSIQVPIQLASLLRCGLCRRQYDLEARVLPKELDCQHSFCEDCLARSLMRETHECLCPICGVRTALLGRNLPETMAIMFLLRELPALLLGRAMLDYSRKRRITIEEGDGQQASPMANWIDQICVNSFLASSSEHCPVHAMPNSAWCHACQLLLCRACAVDPKHHDHRLTCQLDYTELLRQLLSAELAKIKRTAAETSNLAIRELTMLRQLVEASFCVQLHVKREIVEHKPTMVSSQMKGWSIRAEHELNNSNVLHSVAELRNLLSRLVIQRRKCESQLVEVHFQCRMRAAIQENGMQILDFESLNDRLVNLRSNPRPRGIPASVEPPQALVLTNYCVFAYWNELQYQLIPSEQPPQSRVACGMQQEEIEDFNRDRQGSVNSINSSGSHSSSYVSMPLNLSMNPELQTQFQWQRQRRQEMNLRLAHEGLMQQHQLNQLQAQQQQQLQLQAQQQQLQQQQQQELQAQQQQQLQEQLQAQPLLLSPFLQDDTNWNQEQLPIAEQDDIPRLLVSIARPPSVHCYPIYYLDMAIAGELAGRVLVEVRDDAAPQMSENFGALIRHDRGYGYRGCSVFQAWGGESIISGDFESNNGRGGHSTFDTRYFLPDDTGLPARRGTIGMRRGQRRHDRSGFVGSQFRLVLNEMRSFTAIFGYIIEGIETVDRIAATGNAIGRLAVKCIIRDCGEYHRNE